MDIGIFYALNSLAGRSAVLDAVCVFLASWLIWFEIAAVLVFWFAGRAKRTTVLISAGLSVATAWLLNRAVDIFYFRPRPFAAIAGVTLLVSKSTLDKSFFSYHAAVAAALATAVYLVDRRWGLPLFAAAFLVGVGRVLVGVHYPSDVLVGAAVGVGSALACHFLIHRFLHTHHHAKP